MPASTPSSSVSPPESGPTRPKWWSRLGIIICAVVILLWTLRPGSGGGFQAVPIVPAPAPAWSITNVAGGLLTSGQFTGQVLVVNFWATWCPPCIRELPDLNAFHLAHTHDRVSLIGVSVDETGPESVREFVRRKGLAYPVGMVSGEMSAGFGAEGPIPTTYILDRQGRFVARYLGPLTRAELDRVTAPLIAAP